MTDDAADYASGSGFVSTTIGRLGAPMLVTEVNQIPFTHARTKQDVRSGQICGDVFEWKARYIYLIGLFTAQVKVPI